MDAVYVFEGISALAVLCLVLYLAFKRFERRNRDEVLLALMDGPMGVRAFHGLLEPRFGAGLSRALVKELEERDLIVQCHLNGVDAYALTEAGEVEAWRARTPKRT